MQVIETAAEDATGKRVVIEGRRDCDGDQLWRIAAHEPLVETSGAVLGAQDENDFGEITVTELAGNVYDLSPSRFIRFPHQEHTSQRHSQRTSDVIPRINCECCEQVFPRIG